MQKGQRVLFAVHDWGLGHATRSLLLIRALINRGDTVTVFMAPGNGLNLLRAELGEDCDFYPFADFPKPFSRIPALFYVKMALVTPLVWLCFKREHWRTERLVRERGFDLIVSDSRFGVWSHSVPSYCIFHSLRQIIPGRPGWMETLVEWGQRRLLRHFRKVLIPDNQANGGLSGELGHDPALDWGHDRLCYIGPLSGIRRMDVAEDIDYFFSISGVEPHRSWLEQCALAAAHNLPGRVVITRGRSDAANETQTSGNTTIYGCLDRNSQADMLNRAHVVISRSGYTTLMELAELGKRALLIPTPGQSEQEYLGQLHHDRGSIYSTPQNRLDLLHGLQEAAKRPGLPRTETADSVQRFLDSMT